MTADFPNCEFRSISSGTSPKTGRAWNKVHWEDAQGQAYESWVSPEVAQSFYVLNKGDVVNLTVRLYNQATQYGNQIRVAVDGFNYSK